MTSLTDYTEQEKEGTGGRPECKTQKRWNFVKDDRAMKVSREKLEEYSNVF